MTTNSVTRPGLGRWATRLVATGAAIALLGGGLLPQQSAVAAPRPEAGNGTLTISKVEVTPGGTITTRSGSAPQRSTTVPASAALIAITASDSVATSRSPGTRAGDSGGSPSLNAEPGNAATE